MVNVKTVFKQKYCCINKLFDVFYRIVNSCLLVIVIPVADVEGVFNS